MSDEKTKTVEDLVEDFDKDGIAVMKLTKDDDSPEKAVEKLDAFLKEIFGE